MRRWLFVLLLPLALRAGGWDPVPPEIWAIKADPTKSSSGAIFLQDFSRYGVNDTEHRLRVLILSEAGKSAVQLEPFSPLLDEVEGRVLYPDGKETDFSKAQDFSDQVVKVGSNDVSQKVVVPPGLTDHCIVDIHWRDRGTYLWGTRFDRWIQRAYPIKNLELRLTLRSELASAWLKPSSMVMTSKEEDGYLVYTFKDLPALETEPYSREAWLNRPKLMCFAQPYELREAAIKASNIYWDSAAKRIVEPAYSNLKVGRKFWALDQEIISGLPADPIEKAQAIIDRLYSKILNVSALTAAEREARKKRDEKAAIDSMDLNEAADRGWTDGSGMFYLAYKIFQSANLYPKILYVADRDQRGFRYELPDFYQFDNILLGVDSADGKSILWCDPSVKYLPPGVISPDFQGTKALAFDSKDWTAHPYLVPTQPAVLNRREYQYEVVPGEDGDSFKVHAAFQGFEEWVERAKYYGKLPKDAERHLKEEIEASKQYTVTRVTITNGAERGKPMMWDAEGTREAEGGRRRAVNPFPALDCPLWIPSAWPEHRIDPVVMAYASTHHSSSRIQIPDGWKATIPDAIDKSNRFGKVTWQAKAIQDDRGRAVSVSYDVVVSSQFGGPEAEADLRNLLAWVQDAWNQRIGLERAR